MAANPAMKTAAKRHTGVMAAPLNELQNAETRVRDTAARRQSDALQYNAFVLGQQGKLAAAAQQADRGAVQGTAAIQGMSAAANQGAQQRLQAARAAQGIGGAVPSQQMAGLVDDQQRSNLLMAATTQRAHDQANTNTGKAGFLAAAAQASHQAQTRAIAGQEFEQTSGIRREKVGLLGQKEQIIAQQRAAEEAARAEIARAQIEAEQRAADRASREAIASGNNAVAMAGVEARQMEGESDRAFQARQRSLDRRVRLRTSTTAAKALGYVDPKERKARGQAVSQVQSQRDAAVAAAKLAVKHSKSARSPEGLRSFLSTEPALKGAPREVVEYAMAAALRGRARVSSKGGKSAARRYYEYENRVRRGLA